MFNKFKVFLSIFIVFLVFSCSFTGTPVNNSSDDDEDNPFLLSDKTPPVLNSITATTTPSTNPVKINGSGTVHVSVNATDDGGSGIYDILIYAESPVNYQGIETYLTYNSSSGLWEGNLNFQTYHENGEWVISEIGISDKAGNYINLDYSDGISDQYYIDDEDNITSIGLIKIIANTSNPDTTPPTLTSVSVTPGTINGSGNTIIKVGANDINGISDIEVQVVNPSNTLDKEIELTFNSISGLWEGAITFHTYDENGNWKIDNIDIEDIPGNDGEYEYTSTNYFIDGADSHVASVTINANTTNPDILKPVLNSITVSSDTITGAGSVSVEIYATDVGTGVESVEIDLQHSSGIYYEGGDIELTYNSVTGFWEGVIIFDSSHITGQWIIYYINLGDIAGNYVGYSYNPPNSNYYLWETDSYSTIPVVSIIKN